MEWEGDDGHLDETIAGKIDDARQREAASVVVAAHLSPLLQPAPQDVPPLHDAHIPAVRPHCFSLRLPDRQRNRSFRPYA